MDKHMKKHRWALSDGSEAELSFSGHFDNFIRKYRGKELVEDVFMFNCGIVSVMPYILRFCFQKKVDLKGNAFLRELPHYDASEIDEYLIKSVLQMPLRNDRGTVRSVKGGLVIYSLPRQPANDGISFGQKDVSGLVEGVIKVLDCDGTPDARTTCIQTVHYYHRCLDEKILGR
ncbi:MAG: hypothetical protein V1866_01665 [archaeon]